MQTVSPSEFKHGLVLVLEGTLQVIEDFHLSGAAQARHKLHARLRNLLNGHVSERVFAENERLPVAQLETRRVSYSYAREGTHVFTDLETYEELDLSHERLGERHWFLQENQECKAMLLDGKLMEIVLPPQVSLEVTDTAPPLRGSSDSAWKEAKLSTGLQIMVPLFIAKLDLIRIDTATRKYLGKEALEKHA